MAAGRTRLRQVPGRPQHLVRQPRAAPVHLALVLQRAAGNQAVAALLRKKKKKKKAGCPVAPLSTITDTDAQAMEGGQRILWSNTATGLQAAADTLIQSITDAGGTAAVTSAYRPQAYQDHLYEVWSKAKKLKKHTGTACDTVRAAVDAEMSNHALNVNRLVGKTSNHRNGRAVDIGWTLPAALTRDICKMAPARSGTRDTAPTQEQCIDSLAAAAGLTHRLHERDLPHFELL